MKRYNSVFELAAELDAKGFIKDRDITIPADESPNGDPNAGCLHCPDGTLYSYPKFNTYYISLNKKITDQERMGDEAFERAVAEYWQKELAKPRRPVYYLPTAQRGPESFHEPIENL